MITEQAQRLLSLRGIDLETASRYGISSVVTDKDGDWIELPYMRGSEIVNIKRRTLSGNMRVSYDNRPRKRFWNGDVLDDPTLDNEPVIICQDELDAIALLQSGHARVIAIPDLPDSQPKADRFGFLEDSMKSLTGADEVILATNADEHGQRLLNDLAIRIGKARCKWLTYPMGKDGQTRLQTVGDVLTQFGEQALTTCIADSRWVMSDGVYAMSELPPLPEPPVHLIGFPGLDDHYKVRRGDFVVLTGIPSHGKTSVMNDIACRMAAEHKWRIAFASFEQPPQTDHKRSLKAWFFGHYGSGNYEYWIDHHFRFLVPADDDLPTLDWVLERIEVAVIQHNCDFIVIDPWNEVEHDRGKDMSLTEYTGYAIKRFKRLARELDVHLVIAAHPAKMRKGDDGQYAAPTLYDISDSAHWANKADIGITVHRPDPKQSATQIIVNKVRYQNVIGMPGIVNTEYDFARRRYNAISVDTY